MRYTVGLTIKFNEREMKEIEKRLDDNGYSTKSEFIREAVREKLNRESA